MKAKFSIQREHAGRRKWHSPNCDEGQEIFKLYMVPQLLSLGDWGNWRMAVSRVSRTVSQRQEGHYADKTRLRYKKGIITTGPSSPGLQSQLLGQLTQEEK